MNEPLNDMSANMNNGERENACANERENTCESACANTHESVCENGRENERANTPETMRESAAMTRLESALANGRFAITCEVVPGRGALEASQESALQTARGLWETGLVDAISVTDNPSGKPALAAEAFARDLRAAGIEPLVHLSCKDKNRNQMESLLYGLQRADIHNVLCMTGDYPTVGWNGRPRPVFDLDAVTLTQLVCSMNKGMGYPNAKGAIERTAAARFVAGAVVSPFKYTEAETMLQVYKAQKKVAAGAQYLVCQVGFDARKLEEMLLLLREAGVTVPVIANIYILNAGVGAVMNRGAIPGCRVTDGMLEVLRAQRDASDDKGRAAYLDRAARMVAVAQGLGCAGVHLGGMYLDAETLRLVVEKARAYSLDWRACVSDFNFGMEDGFYAFERDAETGLNAPAKTPLTETNKSKAVRGNYRLSRWFHGFVFMPGQGINSLFVKREQHLQAKQGRLRKHGLEHMGKVCLYGCMDCGDCGLYATAYTCPMVKCPKCQRNGACGGSKDGYCEVYPGERYCIWYAAYHRLKPYGETTKLSHYIVPVNDWTNFATSPWGNNCLGRDGYARREFLPGVEPDKEAREGVKPADDAPRVY